mmetsp:Transcript_83329/g.146945  ORF Transcript_83329/g.146945 Transcript_83329/m.146945 type:complete len:86 (-) Transcript_83329:53-310(-)
MCHLNHPHRPPTGVQHPFEGVCKPKKKFLVKPFNPIQFPINVAKPNTTPKTCWGSFSCPHLHPIFVYLHFFFLRDKPQSEGLLKT